MLKLANSICSVMILTLLLVPLQLQAAVVDESEGLQSSDLLIDAQVLQQRRMQSACAC